jgi:hypothetical protein
MMGLRIDFEPLNKLFEDGPISEDMMKQHVVRNLKSTVLAGTPDAFLEVSLEPDSGDDILIRKIDPENALGYSVYQGEGDYFNHISAQLYEPSLDEVLEQSNE